jgi:hypothetical protein
MSRQVQLGIILWVLAVGSGLLGYFVFRRIVISDETILNARAEAAEFGITRSKSALSLFVGIWFCIVNPFVEEVFWRIFVMVLLRGLGGQWASLLSAVLYASYHAIPIQYFVPGWVAAIAVFFLTVAGAFFEMVGVRFGLVVAVMLHSGADTVIACVAADVTAWPWL